MFIKTLLALLLAISSLHAGQIQKPEAAAFYAGAVFDWQPGRKFQGHQNIRFKVKSPAIFLDRSGNLMLKGKWINRNPAQKLSIEVQSAELLIRKAGKPIQITRIDRIQQTVSEKEFQTGRYKPSVLAGQGWYRREYVAPGWRWGCKGLRAGAEIQISLLTKVGNRMGRFLLPFIRVI